MEEGEGWRRERVEEGEGWRRIGWLREGKEDGREGGRCVEKKTRKGRDKEERNTVTHGTLRILEINLQMVHSFEDGHH